MDRSSRSVANSTASAIQAISEALDLLGAKLPDRDRRTFDATLRRIRQAKTEISFEAMPE